jgi:hypothetical protein
VRPLSVVMCNEVPEHPLKVPAPQDQQVIETLLPHGPHPPLGEGIGLRCAERGKHCLEFFGLEPDLDQTFGGGRSGNLLASRDDRHWLIETKGLTGTPKEVEVADVVKHRETWRNLGRAEELGGTVLILGHHITVPPSARPAAPYDRRELVEALDGFGVTVIDVVALAQWWPAADCASIIRAITGPPRQYGRGAEESI